MAKYTGSDIIFMFDNAGGTPVNMTAYINEFNGVNITQEPTESTPFGVSWKEHIAGGMNGVDDITLGGFYDDTATTGPHAIFNARGATRTFKVTWGNALYTQGECIIVSYNRIPTVGESTKYEVVLRPTGTWSEG